MTEVAGIYCRLSLARFGDTAKVDEQERICRELAASRGWEVPERLVWKDNSRSAWQLNRKRPGWDAMLQAVESGEVRNLITYHGDRMIRQPYDLEVLLNLASKRGVTIASPTGTRKLDIAEDRFVLRILADVACLESDNTSRRKKAGFARMARDGVAPSAGGRYHRGFGYDTAGRIPVPAEADALREAAARLLGGEPLAVIAGSLAARGVTSVSGAPLTVSTLKRILTRPRVAGLLAGGSPGSWEPIIDRGTWEMVRGVLDSRGAAFTPNPSNTARHLLSGIARCGICGSGMQRKSSGRGGRVSLNYGCVQPGCYKIMRNMAHLDAYVTGAAVEWLNSAAVGEAISAMTAGAGPAAAERAQLEARRAETREKVANLADNPDADMDLLLAALASFDRRIAELREREAGAARSRLLGSYRGITAKDFKALPLGVRRALVAASYRVTVLPAGKRGPGFRTEDVRLDPA